MRKITVLLIMLGVVLGLSSCIDLNTVKSIELEWTPKERFELNEELDLEDIQIEVHYLNGTSDLVGVNSPGVVLVSGFYEESGTTYLDTREVGTFTLKVSYEGFSAEFDYVVFNPNVWDGETLEEPILDDDDATYLVYKATELAWLTQNVTWYQNIRLLSDIDMGGHTFDSSTSALGFGYFDGDKDGSSNYKITNVASRLFHTNYGNFEFRNVDVEVSFDGASFSIFSWQLFDYDNTGKALTFDNVNVSGTIFSTSMVGGYVGYPYSEDGWNNHGTKIEFIDCENSLTIVAVGQNNGGFVAHSTAGNVVLDQNTMDFALANTSVSSVHEAGIFAGNTNSGTFNNNDFEIKTTLQNNNRNYQIISSETLEENETDFDTLDYFTFNKVDGASEALATFTYSVSLIPGNSGFPRRETTRMNISQFDAEELITTPIQKKYVTQDVELQDHINYIFNDEFDDYPGIGATLSVQIVQLDSAGTVIDVVTYKYSNQ